MNTKTQRLCAWAGPAMIVVFLIGFWFVAGLVPPPSPHLSAEEVARFYVEHRSRIQPGLIISMVAAGLGFPWTVALALQMRRAEGRWAPLAVTQLVAGSVLPLLIVFPMFAWAAAAYRAGSSSPEITQALNDLGWLPFIGFIAPPIVQAIALALTVFADRRAVPVFPRWVGYYNLWCAVLFAPGILDIIFHTGPFAWNGVFAFWIPLVVFGSWFFVNAVPLLQAIARQEREEAGTAAAVA
ncbi:hypothetical protein HFP15_14990 [Amycolatopsis sp. K13G38]|uniref:DUF4386 domain-containing protein n=1 Tax=Amycolatopsis acididurans TaxID=2724524 RepID=A0ABX1J317_9PSEU|nr:hypothetical protein [Amycolatopsis acididurans]NKQ54192.1 hypothetical protein [Amycolatopsis acididurans]